MPNDTCPRIGIFCASRAGEELLFALQSIDLNTTWPDFIFMVGVDGPDVDDNTRNILNKYKTDFPWFDYVIYKDRPPEAQNRPSPSDILQDLYQQLKSRGCTRYFQINDDISVSRYWLQYAEEALHDKLQGSGVVIPHDGIMSIDKSSCMSGFYYFSEEYVRCYQPGGTAFRTNPVQSYWVDTEFCLRAAHLGKLYREPRCCVLHLHHSALPAAVKKHNRKVNKRNLSALDAEIFIRQMNAEGIDPWKYIPDLEKYTPAEILPEMQKLIGIADIKKFASDTGGSDVKLRYMSPLMTFAQASEYDVPYLVSFPRTGSHFLRMMLELIFDKPLLTRSFYPHDNDNYLLLHTHDRHNEVTDARNVIYLYRGAVDTVFSELTYQYAEKAPYLSSEAVLSVAEEYRQHLHNWFLGGKPHRNILHVRYEQLLADTYTTMAGIIEYLGSTPDKDIIDSARETVTAAHVTNLSQHDLNIMDRNAEKELRRTVFRYRFRDEIADIFSKDKELLQAAGPSILM